MTDYYAGTGRRVTIWAQCVASNITSWLYFFCSILVAFWCGGQGHRVFSILCHHVRKVPTVIAFNLRAILQLFIIFAKFSNSNLTVGTLTCAGQSRFQSVGRQCTAIKLFIPGEREGMVIGMRDDEKVICCPRGRSEKLLTYVDRRSSK